MFLGSNIYGHFRRHLLTLNKSLELERRTDAQRIKSEKANSPQTVLSTPSPLATAGTPCLSSVVSGCSCFFLPCLDICFPLMDS